MAHYELWYCNPLGNRIANIANVGAFEYTLVSGDVGIASLKLPVQGKVWESVKPDYRIHIYRQPTGGSLSLEFVAFLQGFDWSTLASGQNRHTLQGESPDTLIKRRINAYNSEDTGKGNHNSAYTANAIRGFALRNLFGDAVTGRDLDGDNFSLADAIDRGPALRGSIAWDKLIDMCQNAQAASKAQNDEIFFGIVPVSETELQFQTYANQPGSDRTSTVFSLEYGNLVEPVLSYDYSDIASYIYVGGKGEGASRDIEEVEDTERTGLSFWGRRERFRNATYVEIGDTDALNDVGQDELAKYRPKVKLTCRLIDMPTTRYGVEWGFGDKITINYQGIQANTIIRAVNVQVDENGKEKISARAEIEL